MLSDDELRLLLDSAAERINTPSFIASDPVQFPRRFSRLQDIEIAALLASVIAWGRRDMICRDCDRLFTQMLGNEPYRFVKERGFDDMGPRRNVHRTFFTDNLQYMLRGLHYIYERHDSLADFARHHAVSQVQLPSFALAGKLSEALAMANGGVADSRCLPVNLRTTPLKRLNMALRWLVRDDGIVDLGVWNNSVISPSQLIIPLDVHVGRTSRSLGLLTRRSDDRRAAVELTEALRRFRPDDPVLYDFALFGIGVAGEPLPDA